MKISKQLFAIALCAFAIDALAQQTNYFDVTPGNGYGIRFWSADWYKIAMGNTSEYKYGPVNDYSIKFNMTNHANRGWTWGIYEQTPVAALSNTGTMVLAENLGVGVTAPTARIDVDGVVKVRKDGSATAGTHVGGYGLTLKGWGANNGYLEWRNSNDTRLGYIGWHTTRLAMILENGFNFSIEGGNVGIGTPTPDAKLAVKGQIHAQEVRVDLNGATAPDYVFDNNYTLRSLEEIHAYTEANKHLPEVPSAKQMEEDGINVVEMNLLLLKKVEELTLYMIEQNKINKEQADMIAALKAQVSELQNK